MRRIALTIAYDGTDYAGWQRQEEGLGIQQVLEETIECQFGEKVRVMGSGRTDAGVHAEGQIAAFDMEHPIPEENLKRALNSNLPEDIRIMKVQEVSPEFQPQFSAKRKTYVYRFFNGPVMLPQYRRTCHHVKRKLDREAMERCIKPLQGEHDFLAFRASKAESTTTVRTIFDISLQAKEEEYGTFYELKVCGNGFLYNMVRIIAGSVIEVGKGHIPENNLERALEEKERTLLGPTAPAWGLMLLSVEYDDAFGLR